MNDPVGYCDELEQELTLDEASLEKAQISLLFDQFDQFPEQQIIESFIGYLDRQGYSFWVIKGIRTLLGKKVNREEDLEENPEEEARRADPENLW